jgi:hypothetical protein
MKRKLMLTVLLSGLLLALAHVSTTRESNSVLASPQGNAFLFGDAHRIREGFRIAPVRLNLMGKNPFLVGLGSYLVNAVGGCNDCHTNPPYAPGGNPFRGESEKINAEHYLAGGQQFGPFTSRNLTPDSEGLPAGLTFEQFLRLMRTGVDLKQQHPQISPLLQVMPWPVYGKMTDLDLRAIYEYLSAIPHAEPGMAPETAARSAR